MAMTSHINGVPYTVPPEPSRLPAILLAIVVHAGLLSFLWFGINWQNVEPVAVEAEVWDMETKSAAPPPEPAPQPVPEPEPPRPEPIPEPVRTPPPPKVEEPVAPKTPDIALERLKEQKKKLAEKKLAEEKLIKQREKEIADLKQKELADRKKQELAEKKEKEKAEKLAKAEKAAKEKAEQKRLDDRRAAEMARIANALGTDGSAAKSTASRIDTGYVAAITSKIKRSTSYAGDTDVPGNPRAVFKIEQLPTGEIISIVSVKSSGIPSFDDAVKRGINNSSPLPKKKDGTVERSLEVTIKMKELD